MKRFLICASFVIVSLASLQAAEAPAAAGHWEGAIALPNAELAIRVDLSVADGVWSGMIDIPAQRAKGAKLDALKVENAEVAFALPGVPGNPRFSGRLSEEHTTITGDFSQGGSAFPFRLERKPASNADGAPSPTAESKSLQRLRTALQGDKPGMAVLVARDGKVVLQEGLGFADIANKVQITPDTKFRIGSITKQFTAAAILRLAEQDKLSITDPLAKYFPDFPGADKITLRHLLTHTSGIHSYTETAGFLERVTKPIAPDELVAWFRNVSPDFAPGAGFHYDNSGYFLLGMIVAKVSGKPYGDFLRETFFVPLGMKDTGVYTNAAPPKGMAVGYSALDAKIIPAIDWDMSWAGGAGALYSTVGDLFRWNEALFGGRVLSEASFKLATTPIELPPDGDGMRYGFGEIIFTIKGLPAIGHGGGLNGWLADLLRLPDQRCTVIALSNAMPPVSGLAPAAVTRALAQEFFADAMRNAPTPVEDVSVDPKQFRDYVGRYDYRSGILSVTVEGDALYGQLTGQPKARLYPRAPDDFFLKVVEAGIKFLRGTDGSVTAIQHSQNGQTFRAPRIEEKPVAFTAEQLDAIVGQYRYSPQVVLTVTRDGVQFFAQLTGQPKLPIFAKSETEFEWHAVQANVRFVKGEDGKVIKAIHIQGGRSIEAPKID